MTESTDTGIGLVSLSDSEFVLENQTKDFRGLSIYEEGGEEIGTAEGLYADSEEGRVLCGPAPDFFDTSIGKTTLANVSVTFEQVDGYHVCRADPSKRPCGGRKEHFRASCLRLSDEVLHLGEGLLDEPTTVRLCTPASLSWHTIVASLQFDPLSMSMVSAG